MIFESSLEEILAVFAVTAGVGFVFWMISLVKQNNQKDEEIKVKDTEIEYRKLKGEIDNSSLLDALRRNNERQRKSDNKD